MVKKIEAASTSESSDENSAISFSVNASMNEAGKGPGSLTLNFLIDVETQPAAAKITVTGVAMITGKEEEMAPDALGAVDADGVPKLFLMVYQRVYPMMYLLCNSLHLPYPAPGLIKLTKVEKEEPAVSQ